MPETSKILVSEPSRKLLLDKKNKSLLVNSFHCKDKFSFLYKFSLEHIDSDASAIDMAIDKLSKEEIIMINDLLPGVLNICKNEWVGRENAVEIIIDEHKRESCSLCGKKNNKWVYNIVNKVSGVKMNVGSTCIGEFPSIELGANKTKTQLEKEAERKHILSGLTLKFPGIENIVDTWKKRAEEYEVLIPVNIESPYLKIGEELKEIFNSYLVNKGNTEDINKIESHLKERNEFLSKMAEYENAHKSNKYIVNRRIVNWLKAKEDYKTIDALKKTGYVTYELASRIEERLFLEEILKDFNQVYSEAGIELIGYDEEKKSFIIKPFKDFNVKLICNTKKFIDYFGWVLFDEERNAAFNLINIFKASSIYDNKSIELIVQSLRDVLRSSIYTLSLYEDKYVDFMSTNQIDLIYKKDDVVKVINLNKFLEEFKIYSFNIKKLDFKEIDVYLEHLTLAENKTYTRKELRELRQSGKDMGKREY